MVFDLQAFQPLPAEGCPKGHRLMLLDDRRLRLGNASPSAYLVLLTREPTKRQRDCVVSIAEVPPEELI